MKPREAQFTDRGGNGFHGEKGKNLRHWDSGEDMGSDELT